MSETTPNLIVLGDSAGLGGQCARVFVSEGWTCYVGDNDPRPLTALKEELGKRVDHYSGDLHTMLGIRNVLSGAMESFKRVDAVIHVPALPDDATGFLDIDNKIFEESLVAPARAITASMRLFAEQMLKQMTYERESEDAAKRLMRPYCFVQIFAMAAVAGDRGKYLAHAAQSMALAAAQAPVLDLASVQIRSNAIVAVRPRTPRDDRDWLPKRTPMGRPCHAEEIARSAYYLTTPQAANMTGQVLRLDGGRSRLNGIWEEKTDQTL